MTLSGGPLPVMESQADGDEQRTISHLVLKNIQGSFGVLPTFEGQDEKQFFEWVASELDYPEEAVAEYISAAVRVSFVVDIDGKVTDVSIHLSPNESLSAEIIRVMDRSPLWEPGTLNGEPVNVRFDIPVRFNTPDSLPQPTARAIADRKPSGRAARKDRRLESKNQFRYLGSTGTGILSEPSFEGKDYREFYRWTSGLIRYPLILNGSNISGEVKVSFVVGTEGELSDVEILRSDHPAMSEEVVRVLAMAPKWAPCILHNGTAVPVKFTFHYGFRPANISIYQNPATVPGNTERTTHNDPRYPHPRWYDTDHSPQNIRHPNAPRNVR